MTESFIFQQNISMPDWPGHQSSKFYGGRLHHNHPKDELDHLLISQHSNYKKPLGSEKKHFYHKITIGTDSKPKPHIRPNQNRNHSTICFGGEQVPKLIKINQNIEYKPKNINIHRVGISKMKNLQTGTLKTGIYRNFYRGQFKSGPQLPSTPMD